MRFSGCELLALVTVRNAANCEPVGWCPVVGLWALRLWFGRLLPDGNGLQLLCAYEKKKKRVSAVSCLHWQRFGNAANFAPVVWFPVVGLVSIGRAVLCACGCLHWQQVGNAANFAPVVGVQWSGCALRL